MSKLTKKIPELRFPEFQNSKFGDEKRFIDLADKKIKWSFIGGPFGSNLKSSDYRKNGVRIIQLQNIGDAQFLDKYKVFTSEEKANELLSNNIYPDDIILSKMGDPVGRACLIPDTHSRYVMCSDGIRLTVDEKKYSKYYVYSFINSPQFRALITKAAIGSTRKRIGLDDLKNLPILLPSEQSEQQKVADFLYSIDELILLSSQKLSTLKKYKKGLIQQLFPTEDKTIPQLRFTEFEQSADWQESKLEKHIELLAGYAFKSEYFSSSGMKLLTPKNFTKTGYADFRNENTKFTTEAYDPKYVCKKGDLLILLTDLSSSCELLGKPIILLEEDKEVLLNQRIVKVMPKNNIDINFLFYFFSTYTYINRIKQTATGSTVKHSSNKILLSTDIQLPSYTEQQKIASFLISIDNQIKALMTKIKYLKKHKLGLTQRVFPALEEVN